MRGGTSNSPVDVVYLISPKLNLYVLNHPNSVSETGRLLSMNGSRNSVDAELWNIARLHKHYKSHHKRSQPAQICYLKGGTEPYGTSNYPVTESQHQSTNGYYSFIQSWVNHGPLTKCLRTVILFYSWRNTYILLVFRRRKDSILYEMESVFQVTVLALGTLRINYVFVFPEAESAHFSLCLMWFELDRGTRLSEC